MDKQAALAMLEELAESYPSSKWMDDENLVVHSGAGDIGDICGFGIQRIMGDVWTIWTIAQIKPHQVLIDSRGFAKFVEKKARQLEQDFGFDVSLSNGKITIIDSNPLNSSSLEALRESSDKVSGYTYQILSEAADKFLGKG